MKRIVIAICAVLAISAAASFAYAALAPSSSLSSSTEGHVLTELWKKYDSATRSDLPKQRLLVLESIKAKALEDRLMWDYYDACELSVSVVSSMNWKLTDSVRTAFRQEIEDYNDPSLGFYYWYRNASSNLNAFVEANAESLKQARTSEMYEKVRLSNLNFGELQSVLCGHIDNDYEFAMWYLWLNANRPKADEIGGGLDALLAGSYPKAQVKEFLNIYRFTSSSEKTGAYERFAAANSGKAVALLASQELLEDKFSELDRYNRGSSDEFKALRAECAAFVSDVRKYSGDERKLADCCRKPADLISTMDDKSLSFSIDESKLEVLVRNIQKVDFSLEQNGKSKFSSQLKNHIGSYYHQDTLTLTLPASLDDGSYDAICDYGIADNKVSIEYGKYTLSLALRDSDAGRCIYVADYKTGEPVYKVDLSMKCNGEEVASSPSFSLVGFTPLPDKFAASASSSRKSYDLSCSFKTADGRLRKSKEQYFSGPMSTRQTYSTVHDARVFTDCGAYNPGDVAHFKAVFFEGNPKDGYHVCEAGKSVTAELFDASSKKLSSQTLTTNEFGSVAGDFSLPADVKGGSWRIDVNCEGTRERHYFIVDEYVLPSFDLSFDQEQGYIFVGDKVTVSGEVKAYSGHSLTGAKLRWRVDGEVVGENSAEIEIKKGGRFSFTFQAGKTDSRYGQWYTVTAVVTDATGETREFTTSRQAMKGDISIRTNLVGALDGSYRGKEARYSDLGIVDSDAVLNITTPNSTGVNVPLDVKWSVSHADDVLASGTIVSGNNLTVDLSKFKTGLFNVVLTSRTKDQNGIVHECDSRYTFLKVSDDATSLDVDLSRYYRRMSGDGIRFQIGDSTAPLWAVVQLWGADNTVLRAQTVHLTGVKGKTGSLSVIDWEYMDSYPDQVVLSVFYFRDGTSVQYTMNYSRPVSKYTLPLSFERFTDEAGPSSELTIGFRTAADAECVATVFDKSTETIQSNVWSPVGLWFSESSAPYVSALCGSDRTEIYSPIMYLDSKAKGTRFSKVSLNASMIADSDVVAESAMATEEMADNASPAGGEIEDVPVRSEFKAALAFEPFLRTDAEGKGTLKFRTSDKLSSYIVQLFAHDRNMNSAALRREMVVTMPVKLSLAEPKYIYKGDRLVLNATLASAAKSDVNGEVQLQVYNAGTYSRTKGLEPILTSKRKVRGLEPGGNAKLSFELSDLDADTLGVKITFVGRADDVDASDAVFVAIPVYSSFQTLTEAHSAVLLAGMDREALMASLRSQFVNVDASEADFKEISIVDMVREALPALQNPQTENVLSLLDAYYSNQLSAALDGPSAVDSLGRVQKELLKKIVACRNSDGGFAWFKDMNSSPVITAVVLQRSASLCDSTLLALAPAACGYLDKQQFDTKGKRPYWCGGLSMEQYLHVRSLYGNVPLAMKPSRSFKKEVSVYLVPKKARGLNGCILAKGRRLATLINLVSTEEGVSLASSLGVKLRANSKLKASIKADYESLYEYAQPHKNGGRYFPNAVMPFRGLLESEAYAHALLCNLFALEEQYASLADDIRLWLMLQKETQQWGSDPAYVEALAAVLDGSEAVLSTKVLAYSKTFTKPYSEVKAAGNGFTLSRSYTLDGRELSEGDALHTGDKVVAKYYIWNEENRSHVRVSVPRPACLRPVDQLSGRYGWWMSPLRVAGWYTFSPQGYRWVRAASTEYWFDSYPEEKTTITETFFVTQEGKFTSPVAEIESLYAPHYRANAAFDAALTVN